MRIISTKSKSNNQILELSWVTFNLQGISAYPAVHATVWQGKSMGKAFRSAGVAFARDIQAISKSSIPEQLTKLFGRNGLATCIDVSILVGPQKIPYAQILEVYSPAVTWPGSYTEHGAGQYHKLDKFIKLLEKRGLLLT